MAKKDPAWEAFRAELVRGMAVSGVSAAQLARALSASAAEVTVGRQDVENWRRGTSTPLLCLLPHIAQHLRLGGGAHDDFEDHDPLHFLRAMRMLPPAPDLTEFVDLAFRMQKLQAKHDETLRDAVASGRSTGSGDIVRAALGTKEWAAAAWPAVEGPPGYPMHVADRVDLRRIDSVEVTSKQVWAVPRLKAALRAAHAVPGTRAPRWDETGQGVSRWSITHVGAPTGPLIRAPHAGVPSIAMTSSTLWTWVNDVASLTAMFLGYGLSPTRDLSMEMSGKSSADTTDAERAIIHTRFLQKPPPRRVWSHHGVLPGRPSAYFGETTEHQVNGVVHIRLVESDALVSHTGERLGIVAERLDEIRRDRDRALLAAEALDGSHRILQIDVDDAPSAAARWEQVLQGVLRIITYLADEGLLVADMRSVHKDALVFEPGIAPSLLRWLADNDCPLVDRRDLVGA